MRVNAVHPGSIDTPISAGADPVFLRVTVEQTLLGREGRADEVAHLAVFLLSDLASYIAGAEVPVDSGHTSHGCTKPIVHALVQLLKDLEEQRIAAVRDRWNVGPSRYDVRI
jgi:hypothetical protein